MLGFRRSRITTGLKFGGGKKGGKGGKKVVCPRKSTQIPENQVYGPRFVSKNYSICVKDSIWCQTMKLLYPLLQSGVDYTGYAIDCLSVHPSVCRDQYSDRFLGTELKFTHCVPTYTTQNLLRITFSFNDLMLKTNRLKKNFFYNDRLIFGLDNPVANMLIRHVYYA